MNTRCFAVVVSSLRVMLLSVALLVGVLSAAQPADTAFVDIVAEGIGQSETQARTDAVRNAVRQAVGQIVSAETLVEKDDLVRDEILTYSDGFVETYSLVGSPRSEAGGLVRVSIKARIQRSKLIEKVRAANITTAEVSGESLLARTQSKREQREDAVALISSELRDMPAGLVRAEMQGEPEVDDRTGKVRVKLRISIEQESYDRFIQRLVPKLEAVCRTATLLASEKHHMKNPEFGGGINSIEFVDIPVPPDSKGQGLEGAVIFVCERLNSNLQSSRWRMFEVESDVGAAFKHAAIAPAVSVTLLDAQGGKVDAFDLSLGRDERGPFILDQGGYSEKRPRVIVQPLFSNGASAGYSDGWTSTGPRSWGINFGNGAVPAFLKTAEFSLAPDLLARVHHIRCEVLKQGGLTRQPE